MCKKTAPHLCPSPLWHLSCFDRTTRTTSDASRPFTVSRRHVCDGDPSDLRVAEAKQECPVGLVFENQVEVLLPNETKYQPGKAKH